MKLVSQSKVTVIVRKPPGLTVRREQVGPEAVELIRRNKTHFNIND